MAKSEAFARSKDQVIRIVATIPEATITTCRSIGDHLAVMPRHVAFILSQLEDEAKLDVPWCRVVYGNGSLGLTKRDPQAGAPGRDPLRDETGAWSLTQV